MIDVKDLRIGNYVNADGLEGHFVVFAIDQASCDFIVDGILCEAYEKNLQPIPITPEWLIKLGFKLLFTDKEFADIASKDNAVVQTEGDMWRFTWHGEMGGDKVDATIWHVHQLQNFFYLMTGEKLTIGGGE